MGSSRLIVEVVLGILVDPVEVVGDGDLDVVVVGLAEGTEVLQASALEKPVGVEVAVVVGLAEVVMDKTVVEAVVTSEV